MSILDVGALAREDPEGSKDSGVNPLKAPGEGLLVFLMETEEDGLEFGKVCLCLHVPLSLNLLN